MVITSPAAKKKKRIGAIQAKGLASKTGKTAEGKVKTSLAPGVVKVTRAGQTGTKTEMKEGRRVKTVTRTPGEVSFRQGEVERTPTGTRLSGGTRSPLLRDPSGRVITEEADVPKIPQFIPEGLRTTGDAQGGFGFEADPGFDISDQRMQLMDEIESFREGVTPGAREDGILSKVIDFLANPGGLGIPEGTVDPSTGEEARVLGGAPLLAPAAGLGAAGQIGQVGKTVGGATKQLFLQAGQSPQKQAFLKGIAEGLAKTGKAVSKTSGKTVVKGIATNKKTLSLSQKILIGAGFTAGVAGAALSIIGTYPFSGFIKEEALQTLDFGFKTAKDSGDLEGMEESLLAREEFLNPESQANLVGDIPYANIQEQLNNFFDAARVKLNIDRRFLEEQRLKGGG